MLGERETTIPDLAEPIAAWRCWAIGGDEQTPILLSPRSGTTWPPVGGFSSDVIRDPDRNFISARCVRSMRPDGAGECRSCPSPTADGHQGVGCGIYAYKTIGDLAWDFSPPGLTRFRSVTLGAWDRIVWGKVLLWGAVFEHEYGYRGEFARVEELVMVEGLTVRVEANKISRLADFYSLPVTMLPVTKRYEIEDYFIERTITERQRVASAMQRLGADMASVFDLMISEMKKFANAFKRVAAELEGLAEQKDEEDG